MELGGFFFLQTMQKICQSIIDKKGFSIFQFVEIGLLVIFKNAENFVSEFFRKQGYNAEKASHT